MNLFLLLVLTTVETRLLCSETQQILTYFKLKSCYKSELNLISWTYADSLEQCKNFAKQKSALALNFSPPEAEIYRKQSVRTCEVLGCPEIGNSSTFIPDLGWDYYTVYGDWNATENATCIKSVGLFTITSEKQNYLSTIESCQVMGADIADVKTEIRTKYLSKIINQTIDYWYKVAYVGMDNFQLGTSFVAAGIPLNCNSYRAWAPGHPRWVKNGTNCVVLDDERMWRVVSCERKFQGLCEFYPRRPRKAVDYGKVNCKGIMNKNEKRACKARKVLWKEYRNASRVEKCEIFNDIFEENNLFN